MAVWQHAGGTTLETRFVRFPVSTAQELQSASVSTESNDVIAMYRLYNRWSGEHLYTASKSEYDTLGRIGWTQEGVGFYSNKNKSLPVYRGFNRYATIGTHHYTTKGRARG